jgi:hypothetical protein
MARDFSASVIGTSAIRAKPPGVSSHVASPSKPIPLT